MNTLKALKEKLIPKLNPKHALKTRYNKDKQEFLKQGGVITHDYRILNDMQEQAGSASGHYFHQDLLVASFIHNIAPERHIDIASRIDGFVAHVAAFRPIEVMDVRELDDSGHENIKFVKADLMQATELTVPITDSISCLHAIEHFGLGRYGDPVDVNGHHRGFKNIINMLRPAGRLYISFPIGKSNEVHFNAHRVFHPMDIFSWPGAKDSLELIRFDFVDDEGRLHKNINLETSCPSVIHGCGIYTWMKKNG